MSFSLTTDYLLLTTTVKVVALRGGLPLTRQLYWASGYLFFLTIFFTNFGAFRKPLFTRANVFTGRP